jgi:glycosyltransferase involved in cell wall biosynthesis
MRFTFFGAFNPAYPRNAVIRKGLRDNGADVRDLRVAASLKFWARYPLLASRYRTDTDIIFVPEFRQKDVPLAALLRRLSRTRLVFDPLAGRFETKIVDWKRRPPSSPTAWWNRRIDAAAFALADLVLADTTSHKDYYCAAYGLDPGKVDVLPLGYDDDMFSPTETGPASGDPPRRTFDVLFYGSFLPLHGADVIVEAAKLVARDDASVRFKLVGAGQTLERVRAAASNATAVEFLGWRPMSEIPGLIAAADICLGIFGRTEKARRVVPHKIFQSLGMRKPVVTARTPAAEEFFRDRETIRLCDEPLAETLAAAVLELKRDAGLRDGLARRGYGLVKECFTARAVGAMLIGLIKNRFEMD